HGNAKGLAWRQNLGNYLSSLALAGVATGLVAQAHGQDGKKAAEDKFKKLATPGSGEFLSPSVDLPYPDSKGRRLVASLPGSPLEEATKLRDPAHFLISRGGAGVRNATQLATNQNYYGAPLVDPNVNPNPSLGAKTKEVLKGNLPIPAVQGMA